MTRRRAPADPRLRELCPACGHEGFEHPGAPNDYGLATCGECDSEIEHGWRDTPPCRVRFRGSDR